MSCVCLRCFAYLVYVFSFFVGLYVFCMSCVCLRCFAYLVYVFSFFVGILCLVCLVYVLCMS